MEQQSTGQSPGGFDADPFGSDGFGSDPFADSTGGMPVAGGQISSANAPHAGGFPQNQAPGFAGQHPAAHGYLNQGAGAVRRQQSVKSGIDIGLLIGGLIAGVLLLSGGITVAILVLKNSGQPTVANNEGADDSGSSDTGGSIASSITSLATGAGSAGAVSDAELPGEGAEIDLRRTAPTASLVPQSSTPAPARE